MRIDKNLKFDKICDKPRFGREILQQPFLNALAGELVACDGFSLAVVPVELGEYPDDQAASGPMPLEALKQAQKVGSNGTSAELVLDNGQIHVMAESGTFSYQQPKAIGSYPDYSQILRYNDPELGKDEPTIVLDVNRLYNLAKAICGKERDGSLLVGLWIKGKNDAIHIKPVNVPNGCPERPYGLVMPAVSCREFQAKE